MFRQDLNVISARSRPESRGARAATDHQQQQSTRSATVLQYARIILFFPSLREFALERQALLSDVISDVQHYAVQMGIDLEFVEPVTDSLDSDTFEIVLGLLSKPTSYLMCFLGDRYGQCILPKAIPTQQFETVRAAFLKTSDEAQLLDHFYEKDDKTQAADYRLVNVPISLNDRIALASILQKNAKQSSEDCNEQSMERLQKNNFFPSAAEQITNIALKQPQNVIFCLRTIEGVKPTNSSMEYIDLDHENHAKIESLKKAAAASSASTLSFTIKPENEDFETWYTSRMHDKYIDSFARQVTERLRNLISSMSGLPRPSNDFRSIAKYENEIHTVFAEAQLPKNWLSRAEVDKKVSFWTEEPECAYYHVRGSEGSGKTALICRLHALLIQKHCYVITRFVNLTHESEYVHELWHGICVTLCCMSGQEVSLNNSFHLSSTLSIFKLLLEKLDRPVFVLIDDANIMKYGRILSIIDKPFRKCLKNLILIATSNSSITIPFMSHPVHFDLPNFTTDDVKQYINLYSKENEITLDDQQIKEIQHIAGAHKNNIVIVQSLLRQFLDASIRSLSGGIEELLNYVESDIGILVVRTFAQLLTATPHGLTSLEILDALSMNEKLDIDIPDFSSLSLVLHLIIDKLGCLIIDFVYENRLVYKWSHMSISNIARRRYLTNTNELKRIHSVLANLFVDGTIELNDSSPTRSTTMLTFPRPLKRDDGTVNTRAVHNLWYHLLHTGNMDALKEFALCRFEYVDACVRTCGIFHLLSIYEECHMQVLHHDIQVLCDQVLLPSLNTIVRDHDQLAAELIGRLRYTRAENSHFLNTMVEQAMSWVDMYTVQPVLVPLTCWIPPPKMKQVLSITLSEWRSSRTILQPTHNHQHLLVSGNEYSLGLIYMYHIASQILIRTFAGHEERVTSVSVSSNGAFFVTTSMDCTVRIWNFLQNDALYVLKPHKGKVICSVVSSDCNFVITGGTDSCANVISTDTWKVVKSFKEHTGTVVSLALASNDEFLVTGSGEFVVMIWDLSTGSLAVRLAGLMAPVSCITMTSNDAFVAVACEDETLRVFGTVSGQELHELSGHDGKVVAMVTAHDDCQLFAATVAMIYIFDIHNGKLLDILNCVNMQPVTSLKITSDNYFLLSACGNRIDIWNIHNQNREIGIANYEQGIVTGVCMSRDEKSAACATSYGVVALWDLDICQCVCTMVQKKGVPVVCVTFSIDCAFLLSGDADGQISIWESNKGKLIRYVNLHTKAIVSILCLSDGVRILSADKSTIIFIWNLFAVDESLEAERILAFTGIQPPIFLPPNSVNLIGYCPNSNKEMRIWAIDEEIVVPKSKICHNEEITCFSTNGTLLATGSADLSLKLWQIDTGFLIQVLVGHEDVVTCCAVADDESVVISGAKDSQIIVWNVSTGNAIFALKTASYVTALTITTDAAVVLAANSTGWIEAYSTECGDLLSSFNAHSVAENLVCATVLEVSSNNTNNSIESKTTYPSYNIIDFVIDTITSTDGNRILAKLKNCSQLPILCLHNTPAGTTLLRLTDRRKTCGRTQSMSSRGSNISEGKPSSNVVEPKQSRKVVTAEKVEDGNNVAPPKTDEPSDVQSPLLEEKELSPTRTPLKATPVVSSTIPTVAPAATVVSMPQPSSLLNSAPKSSLCTLL